MSCLVISLTERTISLQIVPSTSQLEPQCRSELKSLHSAAIPGIFNLQSFDFCTLSVSTFFNVSGENQYVIPFLTNSALLIP